MTVAEHLVAYLLKRKVKHVFGLCGHTNIAVLAALAEKEIDFVTVRHEQIAAHAADGYARSSGKASVLLLHLSPGLTNGATGVANAALDCIPMVVIAGDVPSHYYGKHPHQEVNLHADASQYEIYRPFVKRAWRVDRADLCGEIIEKAFQLAESGQPGPVLVNVPMDVFSAEVEEQVFSRICSPKQELAKPSLGKDAAERILKELQGAKNPLLYVGGGVLLADAAAELEEFVNRLEIPVAHSLMGKGALSDEHPLLLGMSGFWGSKLVNSYCLQADVILALGTRFKEADCSSWYPDYTFNIPPSKLLQIDIEPCEIGRNYPVSFGAISDLKLALKMLIEQAENLEIAKNNAQGIRSKIREFRLDFTEKNQEMQNSDAFPLMPERILKEVRQALPKDACITTDVGWNKNGVGQQFSVFTTGTVFTPGGFATMGFGPAAALGIQLAKPERVVISLVGDGGFGQNPAVLATAAELQLPIIWLVMNNNAFGTIAGLQKAHYGLTYGTTFPGTAALPSYGPNYAKIAEAYGISGIKIESAGELAPALEKAIASRQPTLLDVPMLNNPTPTSGHWNILDIYSPGQQISHVAT